jgi:thioredoxin reductase (NADPH)
VFIFVGLSPNTEFVKDVVELDQEGYVVTDPKLAASQLGIFACGDCRSGAYRQVVTASGEGALAAFSAQEYIEEVKGVQYQ